MHLISQLGVLINQHACKGQMALQLQGTKNRKQIKVLSLIFRTKSKHVSQDSENLLLSFVVFLKLSSPPNLLLNLFKALKKENKEV